MFRRSVSPKSWAGFWTSEQDLEPWCECRRVVSAVLEFTNREGAYVGATAALKQQLAELNVSSALARQVLDELVRASPVQKRRKLSNSSYCKLRVPCSTEILESSLGSFKSLQRHHNRGTFTTLLAVFPTLFETTDRTAFWLHASRTFGTRASKPGSSKWGSQIPRRPEKQPPTRQRNAMLNK